VSDVITGHTDRQGRKARAMMISFSTTLTALSEDPEISPMEPLSPPSGYPHRWRLSVRFDTTVGLVAWTLIPWCRHFLTLALCGALAPSIG